MDQHSPVTKINMVWLAFGLAMADWLLESTIHTHLLGQGSFAENLMPHDANEMWMRLTIIILIISMGVVAEMFMRRQRKIYAYSVKLNRQLLFLSNINQVMSRKQDKQSLIESACHIAVDKGGFHSSWVGLLDRETGMVVPKAHIGISKEAINSSSISVDKEGPGCDMVSNVIRNKKSYICNDIADDSCESFCCEELLQNGAHAAASFPLSQDGEVFGAFTVYSIQPCCFEADEIAVLGEAANDISFALESIERNENLRNRLDELERFQKATIRREFRIKELRDEVKQLQAEIKDNED